MVYTARGPAHCISVKISSCTKLRKKEISGRVDSKRDWEVLEIAFSTHKKKSNMASGRNLYLSTTHNSQVHFVSNGSQDVSQSIRDIVRKKNLEATDENDIDTGGS